MEDTKAWKIPMDVSAHYASGIIVVASMFHHLHCLTILKEELSPFYIYLTTCKYLASFFFFLDNLNAKG